MKHLPSLSVSILFLLNQAAAFAFLGSRVSCDTPRLRAVSRRDLLEHGSQAASSWFLSSSVQVDNESNLVADLEMIRIRLPKEGFGREYLAIPFKVEGKGPYFFMIDTGLTTEIITPHLQQILNIQQERGPEIRGFSAGGASVNKLVELRGVTLDIDRPFQLPDNLHAVVTDFPQEHIDPAHDPIEGMIGMEALSLYDVDFDFPRKRLRLFKPTTAAEFARKAGLVEIPAAVINETGLIGVRIKTPTSKQPILGFLDSGAAFSVVNSAASPLLGIPSISGQHGPTVAGIGIDGRPLPMPTFSTTLTFAGAVLKDPETGKPVGFEDPPNMKEFAPVQLAVGDIPAFSTILGDGREPYKGPAALIGLDILSQRRIILETAEPGNYSRQRRVWVSPQ